MINNGDYSPEKVTDIDNASSEGFDNFIGPEVLQQEEPLEINKFVK